MYVEYESDTENTHYCLICPIEQYTIKRIGLKKLHSEFS
jgi:hypothetical protein